MDLAGAVLHLLSLGETEVNRFPWLEPPPDETIHQALALLRMLGAVDDTGASPLGKALARLPTHPRLGRMVIEGERLGCGRRAALAAALLSERDPFPREAGRSRSGPGYKTESDVLDRVEALEDYEATGRSGSLNRDAARFILRARDQLSAACGLTTAQPTAEGVRRAILAAFPDRVVRRREPNGRRGVMVGGRGVRLASSSGVVEPELFVAVDVDAGQAEALVWQASAVRRDWLPPEQVTTTIEVAFDEAVEKVTARKRVRFNGLLLEESHAALPDNQTVAEVLAAAASERLDRVLPPADSEAGQYLTRVRCLRQWLPDLNLPALEGDELRELMTWLCHDARSFADLRKADWPGAVKSRLTHVQAQAVEREAPERIQVPSGSRLALTYAEGRPPVLAVRIQELFGLLDTPRVAAGRVKVLLHLLAPNHRPQQVTDDLASFWANGYPVVRKELRARYPKHSWPEDPTTAIPRHRPGRRP